jgi:hypothetical protein
MAAVIARNLGLLYSSTIWPTVGKPIDQPDAEHP